MERRNSITEKLYDALRPMSEEKTKIAQALQDFIDEADDGGLTADETQKVLLGVLTVVVNAVPLPDGTWAIPRQA